jgi:hypothetical protein
VKCGRFIWTATGRVCYFEYDGDFGTRTTTFIQSRQSASSEPLSQRDVVEAVLQHHRSEYTPGEPFPSGGRVFVVAICNGPAAVVFWKRAADGVARAYVVRIHLEHLVQRGRVLVDGLALVAAIESGRAYMCALRGQYLIQPLLLPPPPHDADDDGAERERICIAVASNLGLDSGSDATLQIFADPLRRLDVLKHSDEIVSKMDNLIEALPA